LGNTIKLKGLNKMNEDEYTNYGTEQDRVDQYTYVYGAERADEQWILSPYDTWERNPHYTGPDQGHPEDDYDY
jgi:hypothetical protein